MYKNSMKKRTIFTIISLIIGGGVFAQTTDALNTYTPYSVFGIGEISKQGTSYNKGMGGIGVGLRDKRFINPINPASVAFRDTLSFMADFGVEQKNIYSADAQSTSAFNTFNMHNFLVSFPIYKKSAIMMGIAPFSDVGYKFSQKETNLEIINQYGDITYQKYGIGSLSKAFISGGVQLNKYISVGVEANYIFGTIDRNSNINFNTQTSYRNLITGWDYVLDAMGLKLGTQIHKTFTNNYDFTLGATYSFKSALKGDITRYAKTETTGGTLDTVYSVASVVEGINIPAELALGFSLKKGDKWTVGADYVYQNWSNTNFLETPGVDFTTSASSQIKIGFEYTPNRYDIRYYMKRISYRAGLYYENSYMNINGNNIKSTGITLGANMPIYQGHNAVGLAIDMGQRGSIKNNLVRERYVMFIINIHLHDLWFQKFRYD